jgi:8-oxo-dGTP pyrophosphatase MutT (NUDIX family)
MISDIAQWPVGPVRLIWRESNSASLPATGAHGFCFHRDTVVLCDIDGRGLTIPGGHIDQGESIEECFRREASEEACIELGRVVLLGYIEADHGANQDYDGPYPVRSVQAVFYSEVVSVSSFSSQYESGQRLFVQVADIPELHHEWNVVLQAARCN